MNYTYPLEIGIWEGLTDFALLYHRAYGSVHGGSGRIRLSPMPLPLDATCRHTCGLHPAGLKEGFHRIMKSAASPRPQIPQPRLQLPVRPFSPACTGPTMASADFCKPFKIPYEIFSRHRQTRRPPRVRTAAFPPHLLHHHLMVMGFTLSRKLGHMIQPDMRHNSIPAWASFTRNHRACNIPGIIQEALPGSAEPCVQCSLLQSQEATDVL